MKNLSLMLITLTFLCCCIPTAEKIIKDAYRYEQQNKFELAEQQYIKIIVKYPRSKFSAEAMYRIGLIYKDIKKDFTQATFWFNQLISRYPDNKFVPMAQVAIMESPDYTGAIDGNLLLLGDVETSGKNMRIKTLFQKLDYNLYLSISTLFAGEKFVREEKTYYLKSNDEIRVYYRDPRISTTQLDFTTILKYPLEVGNSWNTYKEKKSVTYTIVAKDLEVKIGNTKYNNCIKLLETYKNTTGIKYIYYAPNIGCIKITTSTKDNPHKEFPTVCLISHGGV